MTIAAMFNARRSIVISRRCLRTKSKLTSVTIPTLHLPCSPSLHSKVTQSSESRTILQQCRPTLQHVVWSSSDSMEKTTPPMDTYLWNQKLAHVFENQDIRGILLEMTRFDLYKYFKPFEKPYDSRTTQVKYLSNDELEKMQHDALLKVMNEVHIPPHPLPPKNRSERVIEEDESLKLIDRDKLVFIDISETIPEHERDMVVREPSGVLRSANEEEFVRLTKTVVPIDYRTPFPHPLFHGQDPRTGAFERHVENKNYDYLLNTAYRAFLVDEQDLNDWLTRIYKEVCDNNDYDSLSSTKHFPGFLYHLVTRGNIDPYLSFLLKNNRLQDIINIFRVKTLVNHEINQLTSDDFIESHQSIVPSLIFDKHSTSRNVQNQSLTDEITDFGESFANFSLPESLGDLLREQTVYTVEQMFDILESYGEKRKSDLPCYISSHREKLSGLNLSLSNLENDLNSDDKENIHGEQLSELAINLKHMNLSEETSKVSQQITTTENKIVKYEQMFIIFEEFMKELQTLKEMSDMSLKIEVGKPQCSLPTIEPTKPISLAKDVPVMSNVFRKSPESEEKLEFTPRVVSKTAMG